MFPSFNGLHNPSNRYGMSLTNILNKGGLRLQPCLTPMYDLKKGVDPLLNLTHEFTEKVYT